MVFKLVLSLACQRGVEKFYNVGYIVERKRVIKCKKIACGKLF